MGRVQRCPRFPARRGIALRPRTRLTLLQHEPLFGRIDDMNLNGIDWVIVDGNFSPGVRPMQEAWISDIRDWCIAADARFFSKQFAGSDRLYAWAANPCTRAAFPLLRYDHAAHVDIPRWLGAEAGPFRAWRAHRRWHQATPRRCARQSARPPNTLPSQAFSNRPGSEPFPKARATRWSGQAH
ncbi:MAG: DUF5131 family protein [Rhodospirillales bacterium]|nr:DUF5131 family protein [Acetobacter sp.]